MQPGVYDIDYGVLAVGGTNKYKIAYQFKSAADPKKVSKAVKVGDIEDQLKNADTEIEF